MGRPRGLSPESVLDLLLTLLAIAILLVSLTYGFGSLRRPGPGLYPFFIGILILSFSLPLLLSGLRTQTHPVLFGKEGVRTFLLMIVAFCFWILMMPVLGYALVTLIATFGFCRIMKLEGWWRPLLVSAGTALFIYLLFDYWLYIDLPRGFWG